MGEFFMRKYMALFIAAMAMLFSFLAGDTSFAAKKIVAVMPVEASGAHLQQKAARELEAHLETILVQSGCYEVAERTNMNNILHEQGLSSSGLVGANAIEFGNLSGADYTILGSVVAADVAPFNNILYNGIRGVVKFNFKFVDNRTGIIKIAEMVEGSKSVSAFEGGSGDPDVLISNATSDAAKNIMKLINKHNPVTGTVIYVNDEQLYVDLGFENGLKEGDKLVAYRDGKPIIHPVTQELIAVEEVELGKVKVKEVKESHSVCTITDGKGLIKTGDKVKRVVK